MSLLNFLIVILAFIVFISIVNERIFHLQSDIALIMFSLVISIILLLFRQFSDNQSFISFVDNLGHFGFEEYLMDGVLCFMLFAGASKVNMHKFRQNIKQISLLALLTTVVSSVIYGGLFFLIALLFNMPLGIWECILLGCVVSPTDPIAATGILSKLGLSKNVCSVIENESLFNDGTGVTLFIFVKSIVEKSGSDSFVKLMLTEICGAVAIALAVSFIAFNLIKLTKNPVMYILISLLDVSAVYILCEELGCSGVIASVVCGMYFSYAMGKIERRVLVIDPKDLYADFWEILETILNAVLFVMIGLLVINYNVSPFVHVLLPTAIICIVLSRCSGVLLSTSISGKKSIPGNYNTFEYVTLMTWSALKGGLSLALAISTKEFLSPSAYIIFLNVTYATIFFTVLVQGLTIKKVYFWLEEHKALRMSGDLHTKKNLKRG